MKRKLNRITNPKQGRCSRCGRRCRSMQQAESWNVVLHQGILIAIVCDLCQTVEENAEAEINVATLDYRATSDGRVMGRPKLFGD
ncbi:hypothetical protein CRM90_22500 [Mycobacterium sp. ENV421]|uniref:hypothetical protein n=1 Tax=Mycobacterium sp. ENV421 TaxID=1213407 RepID=UPI000C9BA11E|nr:hypothetical protein [Mycobacterium sp. ENV421]PND55524.1 hypothetical protein CRM90_22500 [Mycobacterium sp. ENV421]